MSEAKTEPLAVCWTPPQPWLACWGIRPGLLACWGIRTGCGLLCVVQGSCWAVGAAQLLIAASEGVFDVKLLVCWLGLNRVVCCPLCAVQTSIELGLTHTQQLPLLLCKGKHAGPQCKTLGRCLCNFSLDMQHCLRALVVLSMPQ